MFASAGFPAHRILVAPSASRRRDRVETGFVGDTKPRDRAPTTAFYQRGRVPQKMPCGVGDKAAAVQ